MNESTIGNDSACAANAAGEWNRNNCDASQIHTFSSFLSIQRERMECGCCWCALQKNCVATKRNDARCDMTAYNSCCTRASFGPIYRSICATRTHILQLKETNIAVTHLRTLHRFNCQASKGSRVRHSHVTRLSFIRNRQKYSSLASSRRQVVWARFVVHNGRNRGTH